jgi:hypothetical protein
MGHTGQRKEIVRALERHFEPLGLEVVHNDYAGTVAIVDHETRTVFELTDTTFSEYNSPLNDIVWPSQDAVTGAVIERSYRRST